MAVAQHSVRFATIYDALSIIVKILYVLGYSGFYQKGARFVATTGMLIYNILMTTAVIAVMVLGVYFKLTFREHLKLFREMDRLLISIVLLELVITTASFGVNVFGMVSNRERHIRIIDLIHQLDRSLIREFGAEMGYDKLAFKTILVTSVFFVYDVVVTISAISHWTKGDLGTVTVVACCYSLIISGMHMTTYGFMTMADVVRIRFRLLQKLLNAEYLRKHFADEDVRASKLHEAVKIYRGLYAVIDDLNHVYGLCMTSCLAHDFTLTTSQLYLMFGRSSNIWSIGNLRVFVGVLATLVPPAYKMVMMPVYASLSINEGQKCMKAIKLMDDAFPGDDQVRQIVGAALRWHSHNKVEYKIGHINCNIGMMATMISGLVNYVIVLIQFQLQEEVVNKEKPKVYQ